jgi:uncharacterized membrane protein YphA (DoxX/SURF4 family)
MTMNGDPLGLKTLLPGWPLALFRILFGLLYLDMAFQKAPWKDYGWLRGFIENEIAHPTFPAMAAFLRDVVLANFAFFGMLSFVTELALGIGLLLGLFTRVAGLGGFLWQLNIALQAFNVPGEWPWIWVLLTVPQLCFAFCEAGRILGLDRWLEPALRERAASGAGWAGLLHHAV